MKGTYSKAMIFLEEWMPIIRIEIRWTANKTRFTTHFTSENEGYSSWENLMYPNYSETSLNKGMNC